MPSLTSLLTVAIGLLSLSAPAFGFEQSEASLTARDLDFGATSDLSARSELHKRALATQNHGSKCRGNYQCRTNVWYARPSCSAKGVCGFKCIGGTVYKHGRCQWVPKPHHRRCRRDTDCPARVKNGKGLCWRGSCIYDCQRGFHKSGNACVRNQNQCDNVQCYPVQDGYSACSKGVCTYHCATYLGFSLFTNAKKTAYRCIDLANDPKNCGSYGNVCKPAYNGKGWPYCQLGTCRLNCDGYKFTRQTANHQLYCSDV